MQIPDYSHLSSIELAQKIGLKPSLIPHLLATFIKEALGSLSKLKVAIASENYVQIEQIAHSLRGSAANLRLEEFESLAKEMEFAAKASKHTYDYTGVSTVLGRCIDSIGLVDLKD